MEGDWLFAGEVFPLVEALSGGHYRPHAGKGPNFRTPMAYYLALKAAA